MSRNWKTKLFLTVLFAIFLILVMSFYANGQTQTVKTAFNAGTATPQTPLYTEYRGVRLGMSAEEARAKLGTPTITDTDQDYYVFSDHETAQIVYDAASKVVTISIDYLGGIDAPELKTVVHGELDRTANGSLYRFERYDSLGFWVSYNRTTGPVVTVTVTLQKIKPAAK